MKGSADDWDFIGTGWKNVEYRSYQFKEDGGDNATLGETKQSIEARRGAEHPFDPMEKMELRQTMEKPNEKRNGHVIQAKV